MLTDKSLAWLWSFSCRLPADGGPLDTQFLNHDISVPVRVSEEGAGAGAGAQAGLLPQEQGGGQAVVSAVVYPLQRGLLKLAAISILDKKTGEMFSASSVFSMLIR